MNPAMEGTKANGSALDSKTLVARLKKAGELEVSGADPAETDSYFDTKQYRFHGPGVFSVNWELRESNQNAHVRNIFWAIEAAREALDITGKFLRCKLGC